MFHYYVLELLDICFRMGEDTCREFYSMGRPYENAGTQQEQNGVRKTDEDGEYAGEPLPRP